jgi:hypothetical protein
MKLNGKEFEVPDYLFDEFFVCMDKFEKVVPDGIKGKKRFVLQYFLNKPWEKVNRKEI